VTILYTDKNLQKPHACILRLTGNEKLEDLRKHRFLSQVFLKINCTKLNKLFAYFENLMNIYSESESF